MGSRNSLALLVRTGPRQEALCQPNGSGLCRYCGGEILWVVAPNGDKVPVDPQEEDDGPFVSHFLTCKARQSVHLRRLRYARRPPVLRINHETGEVLE